MPVSKKVAAAIDPRAYMVTSTIEKLNSTRIVIAHRLSTIINCDRIIVMDAGKIVEQGSYSELMANRGLFFSLAGRQIV